MDGYMISWRICDINDELCYREVGNDSYPLGLDMWFQNYHLTILKPDQIPQIDMRLVSSCRMRMKPLKIKGKVRLVFEGKSAPYTLPEDPAYLLDWRPNPTPWDDTHHLLNRFGEASDPQRVDGPHLLPTRHCPTPILYLLHQSNLLDDSAVNPTHNPKTCVFDAPISIFWGMVGLRTLNRWWVIPELINHGMWFNTSEEPNYDELPYRPVNGTLPGGKYLKVWITVYPHRELRHGYFRFGRRQEIKIDDPTEDVDPTRKQDSLEEYAEGESPGPEHSSQVVLFRANQRNRGIQAEQGNKISERQILALRTDPEGDLRIDSPVSDMIHSTHSLPTLDRSIRWDPVYAGDTHILTRETFTMGQTRRQQKQLLIFDTGIKLEYSSLKFEKDDGSIDGVFHPRRGSRGGQGRENYIKGSEYFGSAEEIDLARQKRSLQGTLPGRHGAENITQEKHLRSKKRHDNSSGFGYRVGRDILTSQPAYLHGQAEHQPQVNNRPTSDVPNAYHPSQPPHGINLMTYQASNVHNSHTNRPLRGPHSDPTMQDIGQAYGLPPGVYGMQDNRKIKDAGYEEAHRIRGGSRVKSQQNYEIDDQNEKIVRDEYCAPVRNERHEQDQRRERNERSSRDAYGEHNQRSIRGGDRAREHSNRYEQDQRYERDDRAIGDGDYNPERIEQYKQDPRYDRDGPYGSEIYDSEYMYDSGDESA